MSVLSLRRLLVALGVLAVLAAVLVGARMMNRPTTISADFEAAVGLYPGSDVQVLGVPVGRVVAVEPRGGTVRVRMEIDGGQQIAADTGAVVVAPTLVSDRFVQLTRPWVEGRSLEDGAVIKQTAVPVEIDELYASLTDMGQRLGPQGANKNGALSEFISTLAANLDGQGLGLNHMVTGFSKASATVAGIDEDFFGTIAQLDTLNTTLLEHDSGVLSANKQLAVVARYLAEDRSNLAASIAGLGQALGLLEGFIKDNRSALRASVDGLRGPTQVLVNQRRSIEEAVRTVPLALQNFLRAYDPSSQTLSGRGNLNELTLWSANGRTAQTSADAPPLMLPGVDGER